METLLTVVIAAYNSEKTIERTLQSLLPLVKKGVEVVVIDDGSSDGTYQIAKDFSRVVDGLKIVSLEHDGSASARNYGLSMVSTRFVMFCDADDELLDFDLNALELLDDDFIVCDYLYKRINGEIEKVKVSIGESGMRETVFSAELSESLIGQVGFWRYLYRTDFLREKSVRFVGQLSELNADYFVLDDYFFLLHVLSTFETCNYWNAAIYKYYENASANPKRFQKQSKFICSAANIQIREVYEKLPKERRSWYRMELRRQLFSSFMAVSLKDTYLCWWRFGKAVTEMKTDSLKVTIMHNMKDWLILLYVVIKKTASTAKSMTKSKILR